MASSWQGNIFFFSSRRGHTRLTCDWSSDVCSSDLQTVVTSTQIIWPPRLSLIPGNHLQNQKSPSMRVWKTLMFPSGCRSATWPKPYSTRHLTWRSEERRVGKECRAWVEWGG